MMGNWPDSVPARLGENRPVAAEHRTAMQRKRHSAATRGRYLIFITVVSSSLSEKLLRAGRFNRILFHGSQENAEKGPL